MQKIVLLGVSRKIFIHSLPLVATEKCYIRVIKKSRDVILNSPNQTKRDRAYETFFNIIDDYNEKILSTKIYWDRPEERQKYKEFWDKYEAAKEDEKAKQVLILKEDIKKLYANKKKYQEIIKLHKQRLMAMGVLRTISSNIKTYNKMVYKKRSA